MYRVVRRRAEDQTRPECCHICWWILASHIFFHNNKGANPSSPYLIFHIFSCHYFPFFPVEECFPHIGSWVAFYQWQLVRPWVEGLSPVVSMLSILLVNFCFIFSFYQELFGTPRCRKTGGKECEENRKEIDDCLGVHVCGVVVLAVLEELRWWEIYIL